MRIKRYGAGGGEGVSLRCFQISKSVKVHRLWICGVEVGFGRAIYMVNSFQFTRSARLNLVFQRARGTQRKKGGSGANYAEFARFLPRSAGSGPYSQERGWNKPSNRHSDGPAAWTQLCGGALSFRHRPWAVRHRFVRAESSYNHYIGGPCQAFPAKLLT